MARSRMRPPPVTVIRKWTANSKSPRGPPTLKKIEAVYETPPSLAHARWEGMPMATATPRSRRDSDVNSGRRSNQMSPRQRAALGRALLRRWAIHPRRKKTSKSHVTFIGGGFGAEVSFRGLTAVEAALISSHGWLARPCQVARWSREDDIATNFYRPAPLAAKACHILERPDDSRGPMISWPPPAAFGPRSKKFYYKTVPASPRCAAPHKWESLRLSRVLRSQLSLGIHRFAEIPACARGSGAPPADSFWPTSSRLSVSADRSRACPPAPTLWNFFSPAFGAG